jgi:hypothetical protein
VEDGNDDDDDVRGKENAISIDSYQRFELYMS